jgi:hypothetical protein
VKSLAASDAGAANDPDAFARDLPVPTSDEHGSPNPDTAERADEADDSDT